MANFNTTLVEEKGIDIGPTPNPVVDTSLGRLFGDIGQGISTGFNIADEATQNNIRQKVQDTTGTIQKEFGVQAASVLESPATGPQPLPKELDSASRTIRDLKSGVSQGSLSQTTYYARLDSMVRQLKSQYPAYDDQIDTIVSDVTGVTPANVLQRSLMQDAEASASALVASEDKTMSYVRSNSEYAPPGALAAISSGSISSSEVADAIQRSKARKQSIESNVQSMNAQLTSQTLTKQTAATSFAAVIDLFSRDALDNGLYSTGKSYKSLRQSIAEHGTAPYTPEEQAGLRTQMQQLRLNMSDQIDRQASEAWGDQGQSYASLIDKPVLDDIKSKAMSRIDTLEQAIVNKDIGVLSAAAADISANQDDLTYRIMHSKGGETLGRVAAVTKLVGPQFAASVMVDESLAATQAAISNGLFAYLGTPGTSLTSSLDELTYAAEKADPAIVKKVMATSLEALTSNEITPEGFQVMASNIFNLTDESFISRFSKPERMDLFAKFTSPAVTAKMATVAKNNPQLIQQYQQWASRQFVSLLREEGDTVSQQVLQSSNVSIGFDAKTSQFTIKENTPKPFSGEWFQESLDSTGLFTSEWRSFEKLQAIAAVNKINRALTSVKGVASLTGGDVNQQMYELSSMVASTGASPTNLFGSLMESARSSLVDSYADTKPSKDTEGTPPIKQDNSNVQVPLAKPEASRILTNEPDFQTLTDSLVHQESRNKTGLTSSVGASGLMQLMPGTAKEMAKELGVPYDSNKLLHDREYNRALGEQYLKKLMAQYGSTPLALAAYNAGPTNVNKWIEKYGDPRTSDTDIVDWVDSIPYPETKKYVNNIMLSAYNMN